MAFMNRFGSVLRLGVTPTNLGNAPVFNSIRCLSTKLFVGGLSWGTSDQSLENAFSSFGQVTEARVIVDRDSGRSRGFGFVSFSSEESANSAMSAMDGQELDGRNIRVSVANERTPGPPRGGDFRGNGYGNDY